MTEAFRTSSQIPEDKNLIKHKFAVALKEQELTIDFILHYIQK